MTASARRITFVCHPQPAADPDLGAPPDFLSDPLPEAEIRSAHRLLAHLGETEVRAEVITAPQRAAVETANVLAAGMERSVCVLGGLRDDDPGQRRAAFDAFLELVSDAQPVVVLAAHQLQSLLETTASGHDALPQQRPRSAVCVSWPNGSFFEPSTALEAPASLPYQPFLRNSVPEALAVQLLMEKGMLLDPNGLPGRLSLRGSLLRAGRFFAEAHAALEAAVRLAEAQGADDIVAETLLRLAILLQYEGNFEGAREAFAVAEIALGKRAPQRLHFLEQHLGKFLVEAGDIEEGVTRLEKALALRGEENEVFRRSSLQALEAARRRLRGTN